RDVDSTLTTRAKERRPSRLNASSDCSGASRLGTALVLPAVDEKKISAEIRLRLPRNRLFEDELDGCCQAMGRFAWCARSRRQDGRGPARRHPGDVQRFARANVSNPCDNPLIQSRSLQRLLLAMAC